MGRIMDVVERFLRADDWPISLVEGKTVIKAILVPDRLVNFVVK